MWRSAAILLVVALVATGCSGSPEETGDARNATTVPLVVDTDVGSDDVMALMYLLQRPEVDLRAITVAGTGLAHCEAGVRNVLSLLEAVDAPQIPVACGRTTPGEVAGSPWLGAFPPGWRAGTDDLYGIELERSSREPSDDAAPVLIREAVATSGARVLALGPLTNVADALADGAVRPSEIVIMGGAVHVPGNVPETSGAEYNVWADPAAADRVVRSGVPLTLVPLDASNRVPVTTFFADALETRRSTAAADIVWRLFEAQPYLTDGMNYFWDPLAATVTAGSIEASREPSRIEVLTGGGAETGSLVERPDGAPVEVVTDVSADAFEREFLGTISGTTIDSPLRPEPDVKVELTMEACTIGAPSSLDAGAVVAAGSSTSGTLAEAVLVRFGTGGSFDRMTSWLERVGSPADQEVPSWIRLVGQMTLPPAADALTRWKVEAGEHALACLVEPGVVMAAMPLTVTG